MEQQARDIMVHAVLGQALHQSCAQRIEQRFSTAAVDALPLPERHTPRVSLQ